MDTVINFFLFKRFCVYNLIFCKSLLRDMKRQYITKVCSERLKCHRS